MKEKHNIIADEIQEFLRVNHGEEPMTVLMNALIGLLTNIASAVSMPREIFHDGTIAAFDAAVISRVLTNAVTNPTIQ